jgi:hypothetical protein
VKLFEQTGKSHIRSDRPNAFRCPSPYERSRSKIQALQVGDVCARAPHRVTCGRLPERRTLFEKRLRRAAQGLQGRRSFNELHGEPGLQVPFDVAYLIRDIRSASFSLQPNKGEVGDVQWNNHTPGLSATKRIVTESPAGTCTVSRRIGFCGFPGPIVDAFVAKL